MQIKNGDMILILGKSDLMLFLCRINKIKYIKNEIIRWRCFLEC